MADCGNHEMTPFGRMLFEVFSPARSYPCAETGAHIPSSPHDCTSLDIEAELAARDLERQP